MKITKDLIKKLKTESSSPAGMTKFHEMLKERLNHRGAPPPQNFLMDSPKNTQAHDKSNDFSVLKDIDESYYKKGMKKQTLSETFAKRFGTRLEERIQKFKPLVEAKAKKYNLDPNLLAGLICQESNFNPYAVSHCGAMGLGQLMPETARGLGVVDPFNAGQNTEGCAKYLREMLDTFGGNVQKALAAYNAGPAAVHRHGGIPPFNETQNYVKAVQSHQLYMARNEFFKSPELKKA